MHYFILKSCYKFETNGDLHQEAGVHHKVLQATLCPQNVAHKN